ncbi:monosaccharide transporter [Basidiobolus meristosporus CBS 931.73]|uniref:Monosaccharide transporter n=1 Tax=Basidiobolus meristosporus CBS 931.73 TaxID=1314790 RepID=A0A1Y1XXV2_9FUNG|nr:monosaccharide transporter [Basidiobolus meristosporus CBS 931.73]|eukprot:ORX90475.1 monosaccharide transporter [Basidiobolus meristosporus CBS 931.73]
MGENQKNNALVPSDLNEKAPLNDSRNITYPTYTLFCVFTACIVRFSSGYNTSSANITASAIHNCADIDKKLNGILPYCFSMDSWLWGFAVGSHAFGGMFGSLLGGYAQEKLGRRLAMLLNNFFFVLGGILLVCSINSGMWICGRGLIGFGCGFGTVVAPTYIGEISPIKTRGTFGAFNQFCTTMGILIVEAMSLGMSTPVGWRILVCLPGVFSLIQVVLMPFCSETPRYLVSKGRQEEAKSVLLKLRSNHNVEVEYQQIVKAREVANELPRSLGIREILRDPYCRKNFAICLGLGILQQWSGINGVMYYSTSIFTTIYGDTAKYITLCVGAVNVVVTIVSVVLIDRAGRKLLLLISSGGAGIFCILMCVGLEVHNSGLTVAAIMIFVVFFAIGLGPIPALIISEMMPTNAVSLTSSLALTLNWISSFVIGLIFPTLSKAMHGYVFLIFASCCAIGFVCTLFFIKETKGKSIEELTIRKQ